MSTRAETGPESEGGVMGHEPMHVFGSGGGGGGCSGRVCTAEAGPMAATPEMEGGRLMGHGWEGDDVLERNLIRVWAAPSVV